MTGPGGGSRSKRQTDDGDAGQGDKITLLEKWKWVRAVVADRAVPREALATGFVVADLVNAKLGYAFAGQEHIARVVGVSKTSVNGHLQKLATEGHLGVKRRGRAGPSHYRLLYKPIPPDSEPDEHEFKPDGTYSGSTEPDKFKPNGTYSGPDDAFEFKANPIMNSSRLEPTKPKTKRSENPALPESREPRARQARQADDVDRSASPVADRPQVVSSLERREADSRWADAIGPEAATLLARDQEGTGRLWTAIAAGRFSVGDVDAGIADWTRNGSAEPRFWGFFDRWAEAAAKRRSVRTSQPDASTTAKPADAGPTVATPGHDTTRWPADAVTAWAARWWNTRDPEHWFDTLGETPDRPDPGRSREFQDALDAGRAEIAAAAQGWPGNRWTWDDDRLGPRPDQWQSRLAPEFLPGVQMRDGRWWTEVGLNNLLLWLADAFYYGWEHEMIGWFRGLPSLSDNKDCTLTEEWQILALNVRQRVQSIKPFGASDD